MARAVKFPANNVNGENPTAGSLAGQKRCWRCQGLMIIESSFESIGDAVQLDGVTRRCLQCGEVVDPVILKNRRWQSENNSAQA